MEYLNNHKYFAQVAGSLEKHATIELIELGAEVLQEVPRGVRFTCDKETLYRIVYKSRLVQRVLAPLLSFQCHSEKYLYSQAYHNLEWTRLFSLQHTFSIHTNVSNSHISNSLYAGQVLKDAICDQFRDKYQARPDYSNQNADIVFNLYINDNWATVSLDLAGESLHKRGYRKVMAAAPMQETLAAAVIRLSGWDGQTALYDPMCGSGTLLAEALMHYCRIPAGYLRKDKGLRYLPDFDAAMWKAVVKAADAQIRPLPKALIAGSDANPESLEAARHNLAALPYGEAVELKLSRFQDLSREPNRTLVTNPPYGVRLGDKSSIYKLYNDLGDFLKQKCPASTAYILCGSKDLVKELRLRSHWTKALKNGDIDASLAKIVVR